MTTVIILLTLLCLLVPVYVYAGYPVLLWALSRLFPSAPVQRDASTPSVTLIISCYNEANVIGKKIDNSLSLDYPAAQLSILVVSDGSDDGSDDIVRSYSDSRVRLIRQEGRLGKTMGLNRAMENIDTDIVVFSDANAIYAPDAIRRLVASFADPCVGYVVGSALYTDGNDNAAARNEDLYWRYELAIKRWESDLHSVVGGDGAIYAIRRSLWEPLEQRDINDFVNPLQIIAKGYRGKFEPSARCYEETAGNLEKEGLRKRRIVNRSVRGLMRVKSVMNPLRYGWFAWEVVSHKLLRWFIPLFLVLGVVGSVVLTLSGIPVFGVVVLGTATVMLMAALGAFFDHKRLPAPLSMAFYFVLVNANALLGLISAMQGRTQVVWSSARPATGADSSDRVLRLGVVYMVFAVGLFAVTALGLSY